MESEDDAKILTSHSSRHTWSAEEGNDGGVEALLSGSRRSGFQRYPKGGGRPKDSIWEYFQSIVVETDGRNLTMQRCLQCGKNVSAQAQRMRHHRGKCSATGNVQFPETTDTTCRSPNTPLKIHKTANMYQDVGSDGGDDGEIGLEEKVSQLQETLKTFRAEVDLKMTIMEQILTARNEQFLVQKKLLEREHALYESVMTHWKNTAELAANGLTLKFLDEKIVDVVHDYAGGAQMQDSLLGKRSSAAMARRGRRKRLRAKLKDDSHTAADSDNSLDAGQDNDSEEGEGIETKIFVNIYSEEKRQTGERSTTSTSPVWKHFLREENGDSAMCRICDDRGLQKILKIQDGGTHSLLRHLKTTHKIVVASNIDTPTTTAIVKPGSSDSIVSADPLRGDPPPPGYEDSPVNVISPRILEKNPCLNKQMSRI